MQGENYDVTKFDVTEYDRILERGLSNGLGSRDGAMCIEAAICTVMGLPHGDDPGCVTPAVRNFKISLNERSWSSPQARADGLYELGLAQLGSKGVVADEDFIKLLSSKLIRVMLPMLVREIRPHDPEVLKAALVCEQEGSKEAATSLKLVFRAFADAASYASYADAASYASYAAAAASYASYAAAAAAASYASYAAAAAHFASGAAVTDAKDKYLKLGATLALECLKELGSPGCQLLK